MLRRGAANDQPRETPAHENAVTDARGVALDALEAVLERGRPLTAVWESDANVRALSRRDRAFSVNLVSTALRRLGQIDDALAACLERPLPDRAAVSRSILRLGAAQILFLETPAHAAVATAVALARQRRQQRFAGLVNAVLRRLVREGGERVARQDPGRLNTPDWLWESWQAAYGADTARDIAAAHGREPSLDLSVKDGAAAWATRLGAELLPTGSLRLRDPGPVPDLDGYKAGAWWVQDAAAALPARLLGDVRGRSVIDLCAAPGGKAAQLAAAGARLTAVERDAGRMSRLRENLDRLGLTAVCETEDAVTWRPQVPADAVMLDAPCTATGTIRRHPDIAWTRRPGDAGNLAGVQDALLAAAATMTAPGGILVYCVCSLQPEEGSQRIAAFLDGQSGFSRLAIRPVEVPDLAGAVTDDGDLRTLPSHWSARGGLDGFYAARLRRRA